jgi:hypothetical protein
MTSLSCLREDRARCDEPLDIDLTMLDDSCRLAAAGMRRA